MGADAGRLWVWVLRLPTESFPATLNGGEEEGTGSPEAVTDSGDAGTNAPMGSGSDSRALVLSAGELAGSAAAERPEFGDSDKGELGDRGASSACPTIAPVLKVSGCCERGALPADAVVEAGKGGAQVVEPAGVAKRSPGLPRSASIRPQQEGRYPAKRSGRQSANVCSQLTHGSAILAIEKPA